MRNTGFFLLGVMVGFLSAVVVDRIRRENKPESAELLSDRVSTHLQQLEKRLEHAMEKG